MKSFVLAPRIPNLSIQFLALALALPGCATLGTLVPAQSAGSAPVAAKPARPVVTAENRLVLMPYGHYSGRADLGSATLDLGQDQTFTLVWKVPAAGRQGQWSGTFEWTRNSAGFESLELYDVREAINGQVGDGTRDHRQAVLHLDTEAHTFAITVPDLGTVDFKPAG